MSTELNDLIRAVAAENPEAQSIDLAKLVADATPSRKVKAFYAELLVSKIAMVLGADRNNAIRAVSGTTLTKDRKTKPRAKRHPATKKSSSAPTSISPKMTRRRAMKWEKLFESTIAIGPGKKILIGDATVADFDFVINDHDKRSNDILAMGEVYKGYKQAMLEWGVEHFRELPDEALETLEAA